ncbi:hypothetical protein HDU92_000950 [Lobulomyces angularis]|nr:hypothetical protein HDU92_000950 [Lobulomyces angularis]
MSINAIETDNSGQPVLFQGEKLFNYQGGVWLEFQCDDKSSDDNYVTKGGTIYQTNLRLIYLTVPRLDIFKSFSVPIQNVVEEVFDQPNFESKIISNTNENVLKSGNLKLVFKDGGGYEFNQILQQLKCRINGTQFLDGDPLPLYEENDSETGEGSSSYSRGFTDTFDPPSFNDDPPAY